MHVESPLLGNIWNPNLTLGEQAAPPSPSQCIWGLMHLGHFTHPQTKIKHTLVTAVTKTGKLSRAHRVDAARTTWNGTQRSLRIII